MHKEKVNQFLSSGKGIIIFPSSEINSAGFNNSLNSIGISSSGGLIKTEKSQAIRFSETISIIRCSKIFLWMKRRNKLSRLKFILTLK